MTYHQNVIKSNKANAISEETKECIAIPERLGSPLGCLVWLVLHNLQFSV